jgi:hypothetical protein
VKQHLASQARGTAATAAVKQDLVSRFQPAASGLGVG